MATRTLSVVACFLGLLAACGEPSVVTSGGLGGSPTTTITGAGDSSTMLTTGSGGGGSSAATTSSSGGGSSSGTTSTGGTGTTSTSTSTTTSTSTGTSTGTSTSTGSGGATAPFHLIGRFDGSDPAGPRFSWPGSAIALRFSGTGIDIQLEDEGNNFFQVVVDQGTPDVMETWFGNDIYTVVAGLPDGEHDLWIERRTESAYGVVQLKALAPHGGQPLVPTPKPFQRTIELIGDSITAGFGADGIGPNCNASPDTMDEYYSYGAVTARALNAQHIVIAYSGIGVYRDWSGSTVEQMPVRYTRTLADDPTSTWDFSLVQPDVVVINLGDNDFGPGDPGQPYVNAYISFVKQVRARYPQAFILLAVGSMMIDPILAQAELYTHQVINQLASEGDTRISFVDLGQQNASADGLGCGSHPSVATHAHMAAKLTAAIKQVTGW